MTMVSHHFVHTACTLSYLLSDTSVYIGCGSFKVMYEWVIGTPFTDLNLTSHQHYVTALLGSQIVFQYVLPVVCDK